MSQTAPFLNPPYVVGLNPILKNSNTNLVVVNEQPLFDENNTELALSEKPYVNGVEVFSYGRVFVHAKTFNTTEDAQNDATLQPGEIYKCNGFVMYKQ